MATTIAPTPIRVRHDQSTNGAKPLVDMTKPYIADVTLVGTAPLLFHAWNVEAVAEKAGAAKGSKAKKTDDVESYVYRTTDGRLGLPGKNLHASLIEAGRSMQDPRSPRKSLRDMVRAGLVALDIVAPFIPDTDHWDYEDKQRVTVQRAGITRVRPAMREGWTCAFRLLVNLPEYLNEQLLTTLIGNAGRFSGLCDFRPTYGRFAVKGLTFSSAFED